MKPTKQSKNLAALMLNQCLTTIEHFGGKTPKDDRCLDLYEALERFTRDALDEK